MCEQFEAYIKKEYKYILDYEEELKDMFKEMLEIEEVNVFFDFELGRNLDDIEFYIGFNDFNAKEDPDKIKSLVQESLEILKSNDTNIEVDYKTIEQVKVVIDFFYKIAPEEDNIKDNFQNAEKDFGFENSEVVKETLQDVVIYSKKIMKVLNKIRHLKLTFTIEDERLINLVDQANEDDVVDSGMVKQNYQDSKSTLKDMIDNFEYLNSQPFEDADETLNRQVRDNAAVYMKFFKTNEVSVLEEFFLNCYLYRNEKFNEVLNSCAEFLNLILKKLNIYKTVIFLKYYDANIERVLKANIEELTSKIENVITHNTPVAEFERLLQLTLRTSVLINYIKSMLVSKRHNLEVFDNSYLKKRLPEILKELKKFEGDYKQVHKELGYLDNFINMLPDYLKASEDMKEYEGNVDPNKEYQKDGLFALNKVLQGYNLHKSKFENLLLRPEKYNSKCLLKMSTMLNDNNMVYEDLKGLFFQLSIARN
jgi:hypothetical protein